MSTLSKMKEEDVCALDRNTMWSLVTVHVTLNIGMRCGTVRFSPIPISDELQILTE
jgi:hypothetical protein